MVNDASCHQIAVGGYCKRIEDWTSIDTFTRQLDLCGVAPGVSCIVAVDPSTHPAMGSIATLAASRLGADAAMVSLPVLLPLNSKSALIADIAEAADFLVDLTDGEEFTSRANAREQCRALIAAGITPERLRRLRPHVGLSRRVLRAADHIARAETLRVQSSDGSALTLDLAGAKIQSHSPVPSVESPIAHWPDGRISIEPAAATAAGVVVAMPGDIIREVTRYLSSPVTLPIRNDHVAEVSGEGSDTDLVGSLLGSANHRDGYGLAGVEIGFTSEIPLKRGGHPLSPYADTDSAPRLAGIVTISFGSNATANRDRGDRVSLVLHAHSINADDRPLVTDGKLQGDLLPDVYESAG